jgi:hypothetical protein
VVPKRGSTCASTNGLTTGSPPRVSPVNLKGNPYGWSPKEDPLWRSHMRFPRVVRPSGFPIERSKWRGHPWGSPSLGPTRGFSHGFYTRRDPTGKV